jgi:RNA polymerase sigma factor (sigma-70 family)
MNPPPEGLASRLVLGPALRTQSDRRLVTLVRNGYEAAFEEIVRRYGKPLGRYAATIVGGRSEDVTQDAFSKALLALRRSDAEIDLRPWLFRIVRNTALNELRDSPPSPEALAEAIAGGRSPAEEMEQREELADLIKRLQTLPEPQRAAIVMRELEGLSHDEIAATLGMSGGAARQAIYRGRRALRDGLGMLVPLPLMQSLLAAASTPGATESATGMAGIGAAGAGAGIALKATAATVLVAGAVGAGVALKPNSHSGKAEAAAARSSQSEAGDDAGAATAGDDHGDASGIGSDDSGHHGSGHGGSGDDHGGHGANEPFDDHGDGPGPGDGGRSGSGHDGSSGSSGPSSSSGPGGDDRSGSSGSGSGSGSSGSSSTSSGSSGSGSSGTSDGSGSSGSGDDSLSSGSGSGSGSDSGSGSGGDVSIDGGSSGSGTSDSGTVLESTDDHSGPG